MAWYAKPSGGYSATSTEGTANIYEISNWLTSYGYTEECQGGIVGNIMGESALNPWRWQSDTYSLSGGYGLFQYTPASGYINGASSLAYYAPNLSTTTQTSGALPTDGIAQITAFNSNTLGKWMSGCWRSYWDETTYAELYALRTKILNTYGSGSSLSLSQFKTIDNVYDATFAFLACFEGPLVPNMSDRYANAQVAYEIITGHKPVPPTPTYSRKLPIIFMVRKQL